MPQLSLRYVFLFGRRVVAFFYQPGEVQACHGLHLFEEVVDRACQVSHQVGVSEAQGNSQTTIKETAVVIGRVGQLTAGHNLIFSIAR